MSTGIIDQALNYLANPPVVVDTAEKAASVPANSVAAFVFSPKTKTGYTPIGIVGITNSHGANFTITDFSPSTNKVVLRNLTATATTVTLTATYLYVRS